ncbi:hypothetical protein RJ640_025838 [Escallonia rubra]|uniref:Pectinesterase catalytic domain-containing protein n=1 Tax=Escallonia rubra TaxID=112253 RepID=A0AA88U5Q6_9ASTE|nr:hypothetical protein RJ640_025838 [Escallonia rubra]
MMNGPVNGAPAPVPVYADEMHRRPSWICTNRTNLLKAGYVCVFLGLAVWQLVVLVSHRSKPHGPCYYSFVVAKRGRRDFSTVVEAVDAVPDNSPLTSCVHIRRGIYRENVVIGPTKVHLRLLGDGMGKSNIIFNGSSPTLRVMGSHFMARDLTIENDSGPEKVHGSALDNWGANSILYRCSIVAYSATIFAQETFQFYRGCNIQGSKYFICGAARALFQRCTIEATIVPPDEMAVITGQSNKHDGTGNGFVFHLCKLSTVGSTLSKTFLGGPLGAFAKTVVMQSSLDASIVGWLVNASTPRTVYFGEYDNSGPGASTRTNSSCVRHIDNESVAKNFTVRVFLEGKTWLPRDVPYDLGIV